MTPVDPHPHPAYPPLPMADQIKHECGLALVRLRQPLSHYRDRYNDPAWGLRRLYLLMEKQHNRGQDGAGLAVVKFDMPPGDAFLSRIRNEQHNALERVFDTVMADLNRLDDSDHIAADDLDLKLRCEFLGEAYLGHLRYATHSTNAEANCHPRIRRHAVASRNLAIAGNFNLTNAAEVFRQLVSYGLNLVGDSDTQVILERIGYELDCEHDRLRATMGPDSFRQLDGIELAAAISKDLDLRRVLAKASGPSGENSEGNSILNSEGESGITNSPPPLGEGKGGGSGGSSSGWDGGYVFGGLLGNGDCFVVRDPAGIRPCFIYINDEVVAVASERAALASVFDLDPHTVEPLKPGCILTVKRDGTVSQEQFAPPTEPRHCTFERIYFSRGNDPDIYEERKKLGRALAAPVLDLIEHDLDRAVFSYIPNTAETAYLGLIEEVERLARQHLADRLWGQMEKGSVSREDIARLTHPRVRAEKIAHKDQRLRTFITHDSTRRDLVAHIYDITRGVVKPDDALVILDDSIVRGTTLRESIITILSRLNPARIVIVSSCPPLMYPDCYGIDMSRLGRFIAFQAAVSLLEEHNEEELLEEIERKCLAQQNKPAEKMVNHVALLYDRFSPEELATRIAQLVRPQDIPWNGPIDIIYQSIEGLHAAMPEHTGDWFFTGRFPTPGGYKVLNTSYLNWRRRIETRAYEPQSQ